MIITFTGHSRLYSTNELLEELIQEIENNILFDEKILFYCGGIGDFDNLCAIACLEI